MKLEVQRVSYGKDSVPLEQREYKGTHYAPVGCVGELIHYFQPYGYTEIICYNKNKTIIEQHYNLIDGKWELVK